MCLLCVCTVLAADLPIEAGCILVAILHCPHTEVAITPGSCVVGGGVYAHTSILSV